MSSLVSVAGLKCNSFSLELTMLTNEQVVSGLLYIHEELGLAHGALNCSTILFELNGREKIGKS